ncbi:cysteine hydrolase family protein [Acidimangrovimonas pyrenivorans]|uniref:Cysteine hydrolase family protein n=1 Tax=Acidimangrovimonas pyrenivorans TaxID=2030798 RepID=A0ABV7AJ12_9RHOB
MTNDPKTLLQLAGAPPATTDLANAAVVLIDAQREYDSGSLPLAGIDVAVAGAGDLLDAARAAAVPVIHVLHHGRPGGAVFDPDRGFVLPIAGLEPAADEAVVVKALPNAFAGTDLQARLAALGTRNLILAGFMTHMCVSSTARAALDLGLACTIVADATATRDLPAAAGAGIVPAAQVQAAALAALADRFARIVPDAASLFPLNA